MKNPHRIYLKFIRNSVLLSITHDEETHIFGTDYSAKILCCTVDEKHYTSRSCYYRLMESRLLIHGDIEPDRIHCLETEREFAHMILKKKFRNIDDIEVWFQIKNLNKSLCKKCGGKGYMDWVEENLRPLDDDLCDTNFLLQCMKKSFSEYILPLNTYVLYRNRNLNSDYMKDCILCNQCLGIGHRNCIGDILPEHIIPNLRSVISENKQ